MIYKYDCYTTKWVAMACRVGLLLDKTGENDLQVKLSIDKTGGKD